MRYEIAIPTYKRPETLCKKTLPLLNRLGVDFSRITLFFADHGEILPYDAALHTAGFHGIQAKVGVPGIRDIRNFIELHYPPGTPVFCIDDDISELVVRVSKTEIQPIKRLDSLILMGFDYCRLLGSNIWGIYPVPNPYFMDRKVNRELCYIVGCAFGFIASGGDRVLGVYPLKDDFERSLRYYKRDGRLVRIEWIAPVTNYYTEPGGIQCYRTREAEGASARALVKEFPDYCTLNLSKKSGWPEVRLKDRTKVLDRTKAKNGKAKNAQRDCRVQEKDHPIPTGR